MSLGATSGPSSARGPACRWRGWAYGCAQRWAVRCRRGFAGKHFLLGVGQRDFMPRSGFGAAPGSSAPGVRAAPACRCSSWRLSSARLGMDRRRQRNRRRVHFRQLPRRLNRGSAAARAPKLSCGTWITRFATPRRRCGCAGSDAHPGARAVLRTQLPSAFFAAGAPTSSTGSNGAARTWTAPNPGSSPWTPAAPSLGSPTPDGPGRGQALRSGAVLPLHTGPGLRHRTGRRAADGRPRRLPRLWVLEETPRAGPSTPSTGSCRRGAETAAARVVRAAEIRLTRPATPGRKGPALPRKAPWTGSTANVAKKISELSLPKNGAVKSPARRPLTWGPSAGSADHTPPKSETPWKSRKIEGLPGAGQL